MNSLDSQPQSRPAAGDNIFVEPDGTPGSIQDIRQHFNLLRNELKETVSSGRKEVCYMCTTIIPLLHYFLCHIPSRGFDFHTKYPHLFQSYNTFVTFLSIISSSIHVMTEGYLATFRGRLDQLRQDIFAHYFIKCL